MLSTKTNITYWQYEGQDLADPELIDKLVLSLCDSFGIAYPHFKLHLLVNELVTNAIDHGVLCLSSHVKDSSDGFEKYLIERSKGLRKCSTGLVAVSAEWVGESLLQISVQDSGEGFNGQSFITQGFNIDSFFDPKMIVDSDCLLKLYGRGLTIVSDLCKSVIHLGRGNCTVVKFDVVAV